MVAGSLKKKKKKKKERKKERKKKEYTKKKVHAYIKMKERAKRKTGEN